MRDIIRTRWLWLTLAAAALSGCGAEEADRVTVAGRWYTQAQVEQGRELYREYCDSCHGERAKGLAEDWRKTDANGNYPPPPLNGSAHAWHHPLVVLESTIAEGGVAFGGVMPGFAETLSGDERRATIAYLQSLWSDEIYGRWLEVDQR